MNNWNLFGINSSNVRLYRSIVGDFDDDDDDESFTGCIP